MARMKAAETRNVAASTPNGTARATANQHAAGGLTGELAGHDLAGLQPPVRPLEQGRNDHLRYQGMCRALRRRLAHPQHEGDQHQRPQARSAGDDEDG